MQQFTTFLVFIGNLFWYHLQINFNGKWLPEGQMSTPVIHTSQPDYALCSFVVEDRPPRGNVRKALMALPTISPQDSS